MTSSQAACAYSRLSQNRDGTKIGSEIQTDGVETWASRREYTVASWYRDPNVTAADPEIVREQFEQMLADVLAGLWKGVLVWRIDRLARQPWDFERLLRAVQANGGYIISTDERLDSRNPQDLSMMRMKVVMGDSEVQSSRVRIKANKSRRTREGLYKGGGRRPYGFEGPIHDDFGRVTNTGRCGIEHVADEVENLKDAARRIAFEGQSYSDVIHEWHDRATPVYGAMGAPWAIKTLETVLTSPRMIGMQEWTDPDTGVKGLVKAIWEPVLDEATWKRLVSMKRRADKPYNNRETYLLTNILRCGKEGCTGALSGSQRTYKNDGQQMKAVRCYRCPSGAAYKARGQCGKLNVISEPVERIVVGWVLARVKRNRGVMLGIEQGGEESVYDLLDALETKKAECDERLEELAAAFGNGHIKMPEWLAAKKPIQERLDEYEAKMKSVSTRLAIPTPVGRDYENLQLWFEALSFRQQKTLIETYVEYVTVLAPGRSGRYFNPARLVPKFAQLQVPNGQGDDGRVGDFDRDSLVGA